jgi:hypothetical protein
MFKHGYVSDKRASRNLAAIIGRDSSGKKKHPQIRWEWE